MHKDVKIIQQKQQDSAVIATDWYEANFFTRKLFQLWWYVNMKRQPETSIDMNIIGTAVTPYQEIKYLGINIDRSLSFTSYISEICKKTS